MFARLFGRAVARSMSTEAISGTGYTFSKTALIVPPPFAAPPEGVKAGRGIMHYLSKALPPVEKRVLLEKLFGKHSREQLRPGSIIKVTTEYAPFVFTGVLIAMRRRGPASSFLLRNIVLRTGVEIQFFPCSPLIKKIEVLHKAGTKTIKGKQVPGKRMRRAKLYYLRDSPEKMAEIAMGTTG